MIRTMSSDIRALSKISREESGCWRWTGDLNANGYGRFWKDRRFMLAHRYVYAMFKGIPARSLTIDHLCNRRNCVNPEHLEETTQEENWRRSPNVTANRKVCRKGHPYAGRNLLVTRAGFRECRICMASRKQAYLRRKAG